jgi:hypothetical protein
MLKFDVQTGDMEWHDPCLCSFGITEAIAAFIGTALAGSVISAGTATAIASVAAPALVGAVGGAATGAIGAAITGGNVGRGALTGGLTGAIGGGLIGGFGGAGGSLTGALGSETAANAVLGAGAGALGSAVTGANPLQGAIAGGVMGGLSGALDPTMTSAQLDAAQANLTGPFGADAHPIPPSPTGPNSDVIPNGSRLFAGDASKVLGTDQGFPDPAPVPVKGALNAQSAQAQSSGGSGSDSGGSGTASKGILDKLGLGGKTLGISDGALALGALSALSSFMNKPQQANIVTPGPASVAGNLGPLFNAPLNQGVNAPGRTAVTPDIPNYYQYGAIPGGAQFFQNNSLAAYGFARGGPASREFTTNGPRRVPGNGGPEADDVPAMLSSGEYVLDHKDVSLIGGGSNARGAAILDRERRKLNRSRGGALSQLGRAA